jgi:hypothetical protein
MSKIRRPVSTHPHKIQEIALGNMTKAPLAQREFRAAWADYMKANFDIDAFGVPILSWREGKYYIIDGQHRIEALKAFLGAGWEIQKIECLVYQGLDLQAEAKLFLYYNHTRHVPIYEKFQKALTAKLPDETAVDQIVHDESLVISTEPGGISAVGTLLRVYRRSDHEVLSKVLRTIRDAFGDAGFESVVMDGLGHLYQRYNGALEERLVIDRLANTRGGVKGLLGRADTLRLQTRNSRAHCVAAAVIDIMNATRAGGKRLPSWWKKTAEQSVAAT